MTWKIRNGDTKAPHRSAPVVDFGFDPTPLKGNFDVVFDTAGTLPIKAARTLLKPCGRIVDLERISQAAAQGQLNFPIARTVPLTDAIDALTELEHKHTPQAGKLVMTLQQR